MSCDVKPITDAETNRAINLLQSYPSGLSRADLEHYFKSDRRGRDIMATLAETGRAAVINTEDQLGNRVYRLACTAE